MLRKIFLLFVCCIAVCSSAYAETSVGDTIESFPKAQTSDGKAVDWSAYKNKTIVFEWLNPDCPFVKRHYEEKTFHGIVEGLDNSDVVWMGVNSTYYMTPEQNQKWKQEQKIAWPIIVDQDGEFGKFFGAKTTPHIFVVGPDMKLLYQGAIDDDPYGKKAAKERTMHLAFLSSEKMDATPSSTKPYGCSVKYKG